MEIPRNSPKKIEDEKNNHWTTVNTKPTTVKKEEKVVPDITDKRLGEMFGSHSVDDAKVYIEEIKRFLNGHVVIDAYENEDGVRNKLNRTNEQNENKLRLNVLMSVRMQFEVLRAITISQDDKDKIGELINELLNKLQGYEESGKEKTMPSYYEMNTDEKIAVVNYFDSRCLTLLHYIA